MTFVQKIQSAVRNGDRQTAIAYLLDAVQQDPRDYRKWLMLAGLTGEEHKRREYMDKAIALAPVGLLDPAGQDIGPQVEHSGEILPGILVAGFTRLQHRLSGALPQALLYLGLISLAEILVTFSDPHLGMLLHGITLIALLAHAAFSWGDARASLFVGLVMAPLTRLLSLSLPLTNFPIVYWYLIVGAPLLLSAYLATRIIGLDTMGIVFILRRPVFQALVAISGVFLGLCEYLILRPDPLVQEFTLKTLWLPALILMVFTGFLEEYIFRGLLQSTASKVLGQYGLVFVSALFAVLHIGYSSILDVAFVFAVAMYFGTVVRRTGSLLGVTIAHGLTNICLFLIFPFLLA